MSSRRANGRSSGGGSRELHSQRGLAQSRRQPRVATQDDAEELYSEQEEEEGEGEEEGEDSSDDSVDNEAVPKRKKKGTLAQEDINRLVKNFVRFALACEYTRTPLRRDEISKKVLEGKYPRAFNEVFEATQTRLQSVFRMKLVELPAKEKHESVHQKRRALQNSKPTPPMKQWILMSTLPDYIRALPNIVDRDDQNGATYQGLLTVIVALIHLNNGVLPEGDSRGDWINSETLIRYLRYLSIEDTTPLMTTDKLLNLMAKQGYIDKVKDTVSGEPRHDYHLGPRGKLEIGKNGTLDFVKKVFGDDMSADLEKRIEMTMSDLRSVLAPNEEDDDGVSRKRARQDNEEEDRPSRNHSQTEDAPRTRRRRRIEEEEEEAGEVEEEDAPRAQRRGVGRESAPSRRSSRGRRGSRVVRGGRDS